MIYSNSKMKVLNINNPQNRLAPSGYSSWKDFYIQKHGSWKSSCACTTCGNKADLGTHVQKVSSYDNKIYIIPLCIYHNNQFDKELDIDPDWLESTDKKEL